MRSLRQVCGKSRLLCRILTTGTCSKFSKNGVHPFSQARKSEEDDLTAALFVPGYKGIDIASVVSPYLNFSKQLENVAEFENNIAMRGLSVDVADITSKWNKWKLLLNQRAVVEEKKQKITKALRAIDKKPKKKESANEMKEQGKKLREEAKALAQQVWDLEETAIITMLQLPNSIHHTTPQQDKLLFIFLDKPDFSFTPRDHVKLGKMTGELEFMDNSPTSYYLKKTLSILEIVCSNHFLSSFKTEKFLPICNSDFVKAAVLEGSGMHYIDRHHFNKVMGQESKREEHPLHLVGGGSLPAFAAYLTKQVVEKADQLPQKFITIGRNYQPVENGSGLFGCRQRSHVEGFILYRGAGDDDYLYEKSIVDETLIPLIRSYCKFGLHLRVVQYSGRHLRMHESGAVGVELFSPSSEEYHEVARMSLCGDYISKRLWIMGKLEKNSASFLSMVHIQICNVTHLLALIMENCQTEDGKYVIPEDLQSWIDSF